MFKMKLDSLVVKACALLMCSFICFTIVALNFIGNDSYTPYLTWDAILVPIFRAPEWLIWSLAALCIISFLAAIHIINNDEDIPTENKDEHAPSKEKTALEDWRSKHENIMQRNRVSQL